MTDHIDDPCDELPVQLIGANWAIAIRHHLTHGGTSFHYHTKASAIPIADLFGKPSYDAQAVHNVFTGKRR